MAKIGTTYRVMALIYPKPAAGVAEMQEWENANDYALGGSSRIAKMD